MGLKSTVSELWLLLVLGRLAVASCIGADGNVLLQAHVEVTHQLGLNLEGKTHLKGSEAVLTNLTKVVSESGQAKEGDNAWVLTSSALVLLMTPGLAFFYGGLVRDTSIINTMMMSLIAMGLIGLVWMFLGFSLAFGGTGAFIGNFDYVFMTGMDNKTWGDTTIWQLAFAIFQMTFAIIAAAIMSGSLVERVRFASYCVLIVLWCLLVYVPICHWVWGSGGWLLALDVKDFAGGTVVHVSSGTSGLVAATLLGPRQQPLQNNKKESVPHNVPFVLLGAAMLWFGWSGFNGGSALAADATAARALAATYLAASAAMIVWVAIESVRMKAASSVGAMVGAVAGLVIITPAAGYVSPIGAVCMGILGTPVCYFSVVALNKFERLDDTLDAFGLHGVGGIVGAVLTGIFAEDGGLLYTGNWMLVVWQLVGALSGLAYAAVVTGILFGLLKLLMRVRVREELEAHGVDKAFHGEDAYAWRTATGLPAGWEEEEEESGSSEDAVASS